MGRERDGRTREVTRGMEGREEGERKGEDARKERGSGLWRGRQAALVTLMSHSTVEEKERDREVHRQDLMWPHTSSRGPLLETFCTATIILGLAECPLSGTERLQLSVSRRLKMY